MAVAAAAALFVAACGSDPTTEAGSSPDDTSAVTEAPDAGSTEAPDPDATGEPDGVLRVGCATGPYFPVTALDAAPPLLADSAVPEVADAIAPFLESGEGDFWPQEGYRVLEIVPEDRVQLVHPGSAEHPDLAFMGAEWTGDGWRWSGSSIPNECELVVEPSEEFGVVEWELDPEAAPLDATSTVIPVLATERGCASGQPMGDRFREPEVTMTDDAVLISLTVVPPEGGQNCPSNPSQAVDIELPEPLGDRDVRDARDTDLGDLQEVLQTLIAADA